MVLRCEPVPAWLLVCGGFHHRGAMDRANLALAEHLLACGREVHLVGHDIDPSIEVRRGVYAHRVPRLGSVAAGEVMLDRTARRVARDARQSAPALYVLANGGNCAAADANWVHSVHHVWPSGTGHAPVAHRMKRVLERRWFRRRERRAIGSARVVIANSERTREDLLAHFSLDPARVHVIPPGADPSWRPASEEERAAARMRVGVDGPSVLFIGALGADDNKGVGPLLAAWEQLAMDSSWRATLLVAGSGPLLTQWKSATVARGLDRHVRFLGFVSDLKTVFAASDVLVSASRYEAYGMAVAEALCRGVPAIVPAGAGIVPCLGPELAGLIMDGPVSSARVADATRRWAADPVRWRAAAAHAGARLRQYTLGDMAGAIVRAVEA